MVEMPMAHDQSIDLLHVYAHNAHIVDEHVWRVAVVEHQRSRLTASLRFKPQREAPLRVNHVATRDRGRLHADAVDSCRAQEKIVRGVNQHPNRQLVYRRHLDRRR
jgi:hypothetical protein